MTNDFLPFFGFSSSPEIYTISSLPSILRGLSSYSPSTFLHFSSFYSKRLLPYIIHSTLHSQKVRKKLHSSSYYQNVVSEGTYHGANIAQTEHWKSDVKTCHCANVSLCPHSVVPNIENAPMWPISPRTKPDPKLPYLNPTLTLALT